MDVFDIRRANLEALVQALEAKGLRRGEAATQLNLGASHMSQMLGGKKMGEEVARKIEDARKLAHGWMDQIHDTVSYRSAVAENSTPYYASQHLRIDPETIAAALKLVRLSFLNLSKVIDQEVNGLPLAFAYEYLIQRQENAVTAENVIDFSARLQKQLEDSADVEQHQTSAGIA